MPVALFIVGTSHDLQCGLTSNTAAFEAELDQICEKHKIKRIAEEMSADGLRNHQVDETVAVRIAPRHACQHEYIDLTQEEREGLHLGNGPKLDTTKELFYGDGTVFGQVWEDLANAVRERLWIARLLAHQVWPTLFICGADHAESVRRLWCGLGLRAVVLHRDFQG